MHPIVRLAKKAVEEYIKNRKVIEPPEELAEEMALRAGVFVSIKKHGKLRGCIGTISPVTPCAAQEAIQNAISSAAQDPRFHPVRENELDELEYSVDILYLPEKVSDSSMLDPKKYGVIVSLKGRRGLLLPDLEGVNTVEEQLKIAMLKAGIDPEEKNVAIERFEVRRYK